MANQLYNPYLRSPKTTAGVMKDVCIALVPAAVGSVIFFGFRALLLILVSVAVCVAGEAIWQKAHGQPVTVADFSAVVTGILIAFNVSSTTPIWVVVLADLFAIIVVKQFFGGLGSNVVNPALMGRLFIMLVYPAKLMSYAMPMDVDVVSGATILSAMKQGGEAGFTLLDAFLGKVPGALGETSVLLLLIGFIYLAVKKEVNVTISAAFFATVFILTAAFGMNPFYQLCSGGLALGGMFMVPDYNFSSRTGRMLYGVLTGVIVVAIRMWGSFPEGVCYAILMVNCMSGLLENLNSKHVYGIK